MRITGGAFRSRALVAPRGQETRPTSDRVREALFSMLASDGVFGEPRVLDLYAGSGALGLEALSRGAVSVVMVESARAAIAAIRENIAALGVEDRVTLLTRPCERALETIGANVSPTDANVSPIGANVSPIPEGPFDLVLIDPPYADVRTKVFGGVMLQASRLLGSGGILVLEHDSRDEPAAPEGLEVDRRRRHGDTSLSLFRRP
jgi:16S rRNA (guanine966-N2)-methyltransferase